MATSRRQDREIALFAFRARNRCCSLDGLSAGKNGDLAGNERDCRPGWRLEDCRARWWLNGPAKGKAREQVSAQNRHDGRWRAGMEGTSGPRWAAARDVTCSELTRSIDCVKDIIVRNSDRPSAPVPRTARPRPG